MDRKNFNGQIFDELPELVLCSNFYDCTFNASTTFERCNLMGCTFNSECNFVKSNVMDKEEYEAMKNGERHSEEQE